MKINIDKTLTDIVYIYIYQHIKIYKNQHIKIGNTISSKKELISRKTLAPNLLFKYIH